MGLQTETLASVKLRGAPETAKRRRRRTLRHNGRSHSVCGTQEVVPLEWVEARVLPTLGFKRGSDGYWYVPDPKKDQNNVPEGWRRLGAGHSHGMPSPGWQGAEVPAPLMTSESTGGSCGKAPRRLA